VRSTFERRAPGGEYATAVPIRPSAGVLVATGCVVLAVVGAVARPASGAQRVLGDGAWSWFADPRGVRYDAAHKRTYVGWVARDGDVKVSAYDHVALSRTTVVLASRLQVDDHANPAIQVLPDGRLRVFYSAHYGDFMYYRTTRNPEDITSWDAPLTIPVNSPGTKGYTYPNPIHLSAEGASYLFWRGGNHNPTFSTQSDGATTWSPARTLVFVSGQRPYIKYDTNGTDTIHFAFTNAHPGAVADVNIYHAAYRAGGIFRANGTRIASLGTAIAPSQADTVYDTSRKAWVHDVAIDAAGRPVIVFASFASTSDHRYMYSRWTGTRWQTSEITAAGGSISLDGKEPYYSAGITLDHEDPSTVYLSRLVSGIYEVETWKTANGGTTWSRQAVTSGDTVNNVRPISPRGFIPFSGDMSVVWIRGIYNSYVDYNTSITTILATGGNSAPIADAELSPRTGTVPQQVSFDGTPSRDPDGSVANWSWDFGDGAQGRAGDAHVHRAGPLLPEAHRDRQRRRDRRVRRRGRGPAGRGTERDHRRGERDQRGRRDAQRDREPAQPGDDLPLRQRPDNRVRIDDLQPDGEPNRRHHACGHDRGRASLAASIPDSRSRHQVQRRVR
jgi:hypothetical protein